MMNKNCKYFYCKKIWATINSWYYGSGIECLVISCGKDYPARCCFTYEVDICTQVVILHVCNEGAKLWLVCKYPDVTHTNTCTYIYVAVLLHLDQKWKIHPELPVYN